MLTQSNLTVSEPYVKILIRLIEQFDALEPSQKQSLPDRLRASMENLSLLHHSEQLVEDPKIDLFNLCQTLLDTAFDEESFPFLVTLKHSELMRLMTQLQHLQLTTQQHFNQALQIEPVTFWQLATFFLNSDTWNTSSLASLLARPETATTLLNIFQFITSIMGGVNQVLVLKILSIQHLEIYYKTLKDIQSVSQLTPDVLPFFLDVEINRFIHPAISSLKKNDLFNTQIIESLIGFVRNFNPIDIELNKRNIQLIFAIIIKLDEFSLLSESLLQRFLTPHITMNMAIILKHLINTNLMNPIYATSVVNTLFEASDTAINQYVFLYETIRNIYPQNLNARMVTAVNFHPKLDDLYNSVQLLRKNQLLTRVNFDCLIDSPSLSNLYHLLNLNDSNNLITENYFNFAIKMHKKTPSGNDQHIEAIQCVFDIIKKAGLFNNDSARANLKAFINYFQTDRFIQYFQNPYRCFDPDGFPLTNLFKDIEEKNIFNGVHTQLKFNIIISVIDVNRESNVLDAIVLLEKLDLLDSLQEPVFKKYNPLKSAEALQIAMNFGLLDAPVFKEVWLEKMLASPLPCDFIAAYRAFPAEGFIGSEGFTIQFEEIEDNELPMDLLRAIGCLNRHHALTPKLFNAIKNPNIALSIKQLDDAQLFTAEFIANDFDRFLNHPDPIDLSNALIHLFSLDLDREARTSLINQVYEKGVCLIRLKKSPMTMSTDNLIKLTGRHSAIALYKQTIYYISQNGHIDEVTFQPNKKPNQQELKKLLPSLIDIRQPATQDDIRDLINGSDLETRELEVPTFFVDSLDCHLATNLPIATIQKHKNPLHLKEAILFMNSKPELLDMIFNTTIYTNLLLHTSPLNYIQALDLLEQAGLLNIILTHPDPLINTKLTAGEIDPILYAQVIIFFYQSHALLEADRLPACFKKMTTSENLIIKNELALLKSLASIGVTINKTIVNSIFKNKQKINDEIWPEIHRLIKKEGLMNYEESIVVSIVTSTDPKATIEFIDDCIEHNLFKNKTSITSLLELAHFPRPATTNLLKELHFFNIKTIKLTACHTFDNLVSLYKETPLVWAKMFPLIIKHNDPYFYFDCLQILFSKKLLNEANFSKLNSIDIYTKKCFPLHRPLSLLGQKNLLNQNTFNFIVEYSELIDDRMLGLWDRIPHANFTHLVFCQIITTFEQHKGHKEATYEAIETLINTVLARMNGANRAQDAAAQSTHTTSVHQSVSESAKRLLKKYTVRIKDPKDADQIIQQLNTIVISSPSTLMSIAAKKYWALMQNDVFSGFIDPTSKITLKQMLTLFYLALTQSKLSETERNQFIIRILFELQRDGNIDKHGIDSAGQQDFPSCASGAFNKFVYALHGIDDCVNVIMLTKTDASSKLMFLTQKMMFDVIKNRIFAAHSQGKTLTMETINEGMTDELWEELKPMIREAINNEFGSLFKNEADLMEFIDPAQYASLTPDKIEHLHQLNAAVPAGLKRAHSDDDGEAADDISPSPQRREPRTPPIGFFEQRGRTESTDDKMDDQPHP